MKLLLVPWLLFLFGVSLTSGHYIRQTEDSKADVYDIKDGVTRVSFGNPKPEKPTLREILYYHVIERERGDSPATERSFTNSHGYQFLEPTTTEDQYYEKEEPEEYLRDGEDLDEHEPEEVEAGVGEDTENHDEEEPEAPTTQKPLTYEDVKEAYKARSYLFDQMRQKYAVKRMTDSLHRKKRQAEMQIPEAPTLESDNAFLPSKTYGMNVNQEGGYVWNNLNKPSYYELGASNGNPTEGQNKPSQNQESVANNENTYIQQQGDGESSGSSESNSSQSNSNESDDLSDICIGIKPCARVLELQKRSVDYSGAEEDDSELFYKNYIATDNGNIYPAAPVSRDNESNDNLDFNEDNPTELQVSKSLENKEPVVENTGSIESSTYNRTYGMNLTSGRGYVWNDLVNPSVTYAVGSSDENPEPVNVNPGPNNSETNSDSEGDTYSINPQSFENSEPNNPVEPNVKNPDADEAKDSESEVALEPGYEVVEPEEPKPGSSPEESPEGINKESYEQTENPYTNPQLNPEEKKEMEDKMEGIFATMQPVEDIPKTYGMNLTKDGGHVWNTLVNPPVSYDVGASNGNPEPSNANPELLSETPEPSNGGANKPDETVLTVSNENSGSNEETSYPSGPVASNPEPSNPAGSAENPGTVESDVNQSDTSNTYGGQVGNGVVNPPASYDVGSSSENPEPNNSGAVPVEPVISSETSDKESNDGTGYPAPEVPENPEASNPVEPVMNPGPIEIPPTESEESNGSGYEELKPDKPEEEESSEGEKEWVIPDAPTLPPLNYDGLPDYIRQVLSSTEKPASNEDGSSEDKKPMEDTKPDVPNTYGMNLNSNGGHVWNDLVNPPVSYDVGSSSTEEENKEPTSTESPEIEKDEKPIPEPVEPIPNPELPETDEDENPAPEPEEPIPNPEVPEIEEDENPVPEPVEPIPNPEVPKTDENGPENEGDEEPVEPTGPETEPSEEVENPEVNEQPEGEDNGEVSEENQDNIGEQEKVPVEPKPEENMKPDIMSELLKSEQFWNWLGQWTATYMGLLEKHIRKIAIQEICNREKSGNQMCPLDDSSEEIVIKDGKLVVEDKEMETKDDESESELRRGHSHNNGNKNNGNKIEASTIYGNSVGNEKVTNVFIFTADKADAVIDKLKPANDSEIDLIIDERIKEENNKDSENGEASNEQSNEGDANEEELNKDDVIKEDSSDAETGSEELNKGDANKEESDSSIPIEELDKEETNKEGGEANEENINKDELNKEDLNKGESSESDAKEQELSKEPSDKPETNEGEENAELNKEVQQGSSEAEAINEESNKQETVKEESSTGDSKNEELNKETNGVASQEQLNKETAEKEQPSEGEGNNEEITKQEASTEESKGDTDEELTKDEKEPNEGDANEKEVIKDDEEDKKDTKEQTNENSDDSEKADASELNKDSVNNEPTDGALDDGDEIKKESSENI